MDGDLEKKVRDLFPGIRVRFWTDPEQGPAIWLLAADGAGVVLQVSQEPSGLKVVLRTTDGGPQLTHVVQADLGGADPVPVAEDADAVTVLQFHKSDWAHAVRQHVCFGEPDPGPEDVWVRELELAPSCRICVRPVTPVSAGEFSEAWGGMVHRECSARLADEQWYEEFWGGDRR